MINNRSSWQQIFKSQIFKSQNINICENFKQYGFPTQEAMSKPDPEDQSNAWFWLAYDKKAAPIFQTLFNKDIFPSRQDLSNWVELDENDFINAWDGLVDLDPIIIKTLYDKGIFPYGDDLSTNCRMKFFNNLSLSFISTNIVRLEKCKVDYPYGFNETMTDLLSRQNKLEYYGFLYLFYLNETQKIKFNLSSDLWLLIASHLIQNVVIQNIVADESHCAFVKYHMIESLKNYPAFFTRHDQRGESLRQQLITAKDPKPALINQYYLSIGKKGAPHQYSLYSPKKHLQPYSKKIVKDSNFYHLLREGFFLSYNKKIDKNNHSERGKKNENLFGQTRG
jgi:hypothetical protein